MFQPSLTKHKTSAQRAAAGINPKNTAASIIPVNRGIKLKKYLTHNKYITGITYRRTKILFAAIRNCRGFDDAKSAVLLYTSERKHITSTSFNNSAVKIRTDSRNLTGIYCSNALKLIKESAAYSAETIKIFRA